MSLLLRSISLYFSLSLCLSQPLELLIFNIDITQGYLFLRNKSINMGQSNEWTLFKAHIFTASNQLISV